MAATYGAEFKGKAAIGASTSLLYEAEYAAQSEYADNPNSIEASYLYLKAGVVFKPVTLMVGYETLGGDASEEDNKGAFATPLATLHKWNGWADKFLATPGAGLNDLYFLAKGPIGPVKGVAAYHFFKTDDGGDDTASMDIMVSESGQITLDEMYFVPAARPTNAPATIHQRPARASSSSLWSWGSSSLHASMRC